MTTSPFSCLFAQENDWLSFRGLEQNPVRKDAHWSTLNEDRRQTPETNASTDSPKSKQATSFSINESKRQKWTAKIPGKGGASSPIVVGRRVFITSASETAKRQLYLIAYDLETGNQLWQRSLTATGSFITNAFSSAATNSPASDGERIVVFYSSNDLACFDLDGNLLWLRGLGYDFPKLRNDAAMSSSPLIIDDKVIVQCQCQGESFIAAINKYNGKTIWTTERSKSAIWSSPAILNLSTLSTSTAASDFSGLSADSQTNLSDHSVRVENLDAPLLTDQPSMNQQQIMKSAVNQRFILAVDREKLSVLDPKNGLEIAFYNASCNTITSPVAVHGTIFLQGNAIHAIDATPILSLKTNSENQKEQTDFSPLELQSVWIEEKLRCDNPSPIVDQETETLYVIKQPGILIATDAQSGEILWQLRLQGPFWTTPVLLGNNIAAINQNGLLQIVELSDEKGKVIESIDFAEKTLATPVILSDGLLIRSDSQLWRIK